MDVSDVYTEWRVPILVRKPVMWDLSEENFDPNTVADYRHGIYRKGSTHDGLVHFLYEGVDARIHEQVENMTWPNLINAY